MSKPNLLTHCRRGNKGGKTQNSTKSGLVYMHSMRIPTDHDLQNFPHVFFTSPDIWDTSVLDHGIPQSLLEDIIQHSDDLLLQYSIFDEYGDLHHRAIQTLNILCDLPSLPPGSLSPMLTCMTAILLKKIGNHLQTSDWTHQKGRINHKI